MTVRELIAELEEYDGNLPVIIAGDQYEFSGCSTCGDVWSPFETRIKSVVDLESKVHLMMEGDIRL